jgi:hypothetical protein
MLLVSSVVRRCSRLLAVEVAHTTLVLGLVALLSVVRVATMRMVLLLPRTQRRVAVVLVPTLVALPVLVAQVVQVSRM